MSSEQSYQPKSILFRNADFTQYLSAGMGIIDFGSYFDNEMSKNKFIIKFVKQVKIAIEAGVCKTPKDYKFPEKEAYNLDKIWNGNTFYGIKQEPFRRKFLYDYPNGAVQKQVGTEPTSIGIKKIHSGYSCKKCNFTMDITDNQGDFDRLSAHQIIEHDIAIPTTFTVRIGFIPTYTDTPIYEERPVFEIDTSEEFYEVIPLPKFKNMIPVNKIADETMLIQLREDWTMKYAVEGSSYVSLINNGGFMHQMSDGGMPMFSEEDMQSETLRTYFYSRPVFNSLMNDFEYFFNANWNVISIEFQKIIDFAGMGEMGDDDEFNASSFIAEVD